MAMFSMWFQCPRILNIGTCFFFGAKCLGNSRNTIENTME
jgi:hypothetical protein